MISIHALCKRFGKVEALSHLQLELHRGNSYAIIGPNGSGKTTLIKSLLGMVIPDSGIIEFAGVNIRNQWCYRDQIGYMPQTGRFPDQLKVGQVFEMMRDLRSNSVRVDEELIEAFALKTFFHKRMYTLSGGMRQKVSAALAFMFNPDVLILDEPTAGLDPFAVEILKEKIQKERDAKRLFLITSHVMSDLDELTSDIVYLENGTLKYSGTIQDLKWASGEDKLAKAIVRMLQSKAEKISA